MKITPLVASIVATYVRSHPVDSRDIPEVIKAIHGALRRVEASDAAEAPARASAPAASLRVHRPPPARVVPAVPIDQSVTPDFIVCLENGKRFKTLKRHLREAFAMSPDEYRAKWRLPHDYPMVAPNYARRRSQISKAVGLGRKKSKSTAKQPKAQGWTVWRGP